MAHNHTVTDADKHFIIDSATRAINNAEMKKTILMQNDHNSEVFSFEIDKFIEGHYPMLCNRVEIHYLNVDSSKGDKNAGVYEVTDMHIDPENDGKLVFTWLISENATFYAGSLSFLVMFSCVENGKVLYRWSTDINTSISVSKGMNNGEEIEKLYPDVLAQWKAELDLLTAKLADRNYAYEGAVKNGFKGTEEEWYELILKYEAAGHNHDDRYYTETEIDNKLDDKANSEHGHKTLEESIGAKASVKFFNAILPSSGWVGDAAPYTQTISIDGVLDTDVPIVDIVQSGDTENAKAELEAWGHVSRIDTSHNAITATCYSNKPSVDLNIHMEVLR